MMAHTVWIVSELYYPEETSTGYLLTRIAEGIAAEYDVHVICAQPTYSRRGQSAPWREARNGVSIQRCWSTTLRSDRLLGRVLNTASISLSIFAMALRRVRRGDLLFVVTNPPLLPFFALAAARLRGAQAALIVHDVYPDAAVAAGLLHPDSAIVRLMTRMSRRMYRSMQFVVVLGRDMQELVQRALGRAPARIVNIPNWADAEEIRPRDRSSNRILEELGLMDALVVQYAGNMGRTHDLESILETARLLSADPDFHFLLVGNGAKASTVREAIAAEQLTNMTMLGPQPRSKQEEFLNACDVSIISFMPGMAGVSVPSRMYNVMASGKPILAMTDAHSELARVVMENRIGWVIAPGDVSGLLAALQEAQRNPSMLQEMGARARQAAISTYSAEAAMQRYRALVHSAFGVRPDGQSKYVQSARLTGSGAAANE